jgi:hypothetical protein
MHGDICRWRFVERLVLSVGKTLIAGWTHAGIVENVARPTILVQALQTTAYVRDAAVAEHSKRLAKGLCDLCEMPAPFKNKQNAAYLECHHIVWLAKSGEDTVENTVALCPNCHRKMHVLNRKMDKEKLTTRAAERESDKLSAE